MPATSPEQLDHLFAAALNAGDIDALMALYEPQASLTPSPGTTVLGATAIRAALSGFLAAKPTMRMASVRVVSQAGDLALVTAKWELALTGQDGTPTQMSGQSVEIVRRQTGGQWLFAIDEPFGVGAA
ncbi:MAG TPA: SgcJ/EcaC family oxidoreductase [Casimicrobiaceae bacterium]|nr:SgcJ/EcaC family oxidoreductase [Casimicrobiaceae bacterium]